MNWHDLIDPGLSGRLCLTLLHSVWQVALLAGVVWSLDRFLRNRSVELRYTLHVGALLAALVALPVTYSLLDSDTTSEREIFTVAANAQPVDDISTLPPASAVQPMEPSADVQPDIPVVPGERPLPASPVVKDSAFGPSLTESFTNWRPVAPWIIAVYVTGVVLMLIRLAIALISGSRQSARATPIKDGFLAESLRSLVSRWSMGVMPLLACAEEVLVPKLVGLVRPTILLPASAVSGLSADELELILAHELAHVRRRDMWINLLQRVAESLLFFNPALWYLTRRISTLREYCCDEMVCRTESDSSAEMRLRYSSALLHATELARPQLAKGTDLAALAVAGRSPSELRRRVARLLGESVREPLRLSRSGWLMLAGAVMVLFLGPALWKTSAEPTEENEIVQEEDDVKPGEFQLTVVGPDGKTVPSASMDIRSQPHIAAEQVLRGEFVKEHRYGCLVKSDQVGRLTLALREKTDWLEVLIHQPGFGPYCASWRLTGTKLRIPGKFTAELDAGWSVGGVIVDEDGQPVEGAQVRPSLKYKKRPGDNDRLGLGTRVTTDANGVWRFDHVPVSQSDVHISVDHPDFAPLRQRVPREGFGIKLDEPPTARLALKAGLTISGTVTDEDGHPIEGALVKTKFHNDLRKATTDKNGNYRIAGCEPRMTRVVVSAKGMATDMQVVRVADDMQPVDFKVKPGGKIRIRVVDENGKGIPKARIWFQEWRGQVDYFEFDHVNLIADENGVWEWDEAPLDELHADIWSKDRMYLERQPLKARAEEYVFSPPPALEISGRVTDAKTGEPIEKFRVTPGSRNIDNPRYSKGMQWSERDSFEATRGKYAIRRTQGLPTHVVRIEADGYRVAISRDIKWDEGEIDVDFELLPANNIAVNIVTADGEPADEAAIALGAAGSQISIKNGAIDLGSTNHATLLTADEKGHFSVPARTDPFQIVITHPAGYAYLKSSEGPIPEQIKLTAWARVEGVFRVGKKPQPNVGITLHSNPIRSYGDDVPNIFTHHDVTTGKDGRFVFARVFAGDVGIERSIILMVDEGAQEVTSSVRVWTTAVAGETTTVDLGGTGRPVVGQLLPPADFKKKVFWQFAVVNAQVDLDPPPAPELPEDVRNDEKKQQDWWNNWLKTPGGRTWQAAYNSYQEVRQKSPYIMATVAEDGSFRMDDVPPGNYVLTAWFNQHRAGSVRGVKFKVPPVEEGRDPEPVELPLLTLE